MVVTKNPQYIRAGGSFSGCPGTALVAGYYVYGTSTPVITGYLNPSTGKAWTPTELSNFMAGGTTTPTTTTPATNVTLTASQIAAGHTGITNPQPVVGSFDTAHLGSQEDYISGAIASGMTQTQAEAAWANIAAGGGAKPPTPAVGTTPGAVATTPSVEEQMALMPQAPTPVAPGLAPIPAVTTPPTIEAPVVPAMPGVTPTPTIPATTVTPAPEYKPTEEEQAWAGMTGGEIRSIIEAKGLGIPEETQQLMIRQQTQALNAREDENLRLMANDMERRGITNSGLLFYNTQNIKSATTSAIANSITDIQIQSSLMKMASFENALGQAGQFLGYLQEQSKMVYTGKMATWEAQTQGNLIQYQAQIGADLDQWKMENQYNLTGWQANTEALFAQWDKNSTATIEEWKMENQFNMTEWETQANYDLAVFQIDTNAKLANWSAKMDIYKLGINQAYAQGNMQLAAQISTAAAAQQQIYNKELAEIELKGANAQAAAKGAGNIFGTTLGWMFGIK